MTDIQQEKLELTEADRRLLEEELSLEKQTDTSSETIDSREGSATPPAAGAAAFGYRSPENFDVDFGETAADSEKAEDTSAAAPSHAEEAPWFDAVLDESAPAESSEDHHLSPADEKWPDDAAMSQARTTETESDAASTNAQTGHASAEPPSIAAAGLPFSQPADGDGMMGKAIGPLPETLPQAQIEAAVKKALKELLGEKIETLLCEAVDKAVSKEIDRMKSLILGDIDHER
jgi:hypothetical protein